MLDHWRLNELLNPGRLDERGINAGTCFEKAADHLDVFPVTGKGAQALENAASDLTLVLLAGSAEEPAEPRIGRGLIAEADSAE